MVRVAYLASHHPLPSQVFIDREIAGLRALGVDVVTYSVRRVPTDSLPDDAMRAEGDRTVALLGDGKALIHEVRALTMHQPKAFATVLRLALGTGERRLRGRVWQTFYFAEAVRLHTSMRAQGLRHVHVHFANNAADVARLAVALGRAIDGPDAGWRWTMTMHGPTEFEAVERFDLAAKVGSAAAVACISDFTRSQLMRLSQPEQWHRLSIVRMSVDLEQYDVAERAGRAGLPLRILNVGRLVPEKGAPVLVEALAELASAGIAIEARIFGGGPLEERLRQQIVDLGLEDVIEMRGVVSQDDLPEQYAWADVFCLPSFQEGLPVVLMEAMATGLPVVTTAINGIPELVIEGETGRLVSPGRPDLVAGALKDLLADPTMRHELGARARARVERLHAQDVTAAAQLTFLAGAR